MWSTWKIRKYLTFKPESSQNGRFREGAGGRELSSQDGRVGTYVCDTKEVQYLHKASFVKRNIRTKLEWNSEIIAQTKVNTHPENQTTFSKVPIFPSDKSYGEALTKKQSRKIYWFLVAAYQVDLKCIISTKLQKMGMPNIYRFLELRRNSYCNT